MLNKKLCILEEKVRKKKEEEMSIFDYACCVFYTGGFLLVYSYIIAQNKTREEKEEEEAREPVSVLETESEVQPEVKEESFADKIHKQNKEADMSFNALKNRDQNERMEKKYGPNRATWPT